MEGGGAGPHGWEFADKREEVRGTLRRWRQECKVMFSLIWIQVDTQEDRYRHVYAAGSVHTALFCQLRAWRPGHPQSNQHTSTYPGVSNSISKKNGTKVLGEMADFRTEAGNVLAEPGV